MSPRSRTTTVAKVTTTSRRPTTTAERKADAERKAAERAERDADDLRAWQMIRAGASYRDVAEAMGLSNPGRAHQMVQRAITALPESSKAMVKRLLSDQVDDVYREIRPIIAGRVRRMNDHGEYVNDEEGRPLYDVVPVSERRATARVATALFARKAHLWGADAPEVKVIEISVVTDEALADDQRLIADELAAMGINVEELFPSVERLVEAIDVRSAVKERPELPPAE